MAIGPQDPKRLARASVWISANKNGDTSGGPVERFFKLLAATQESNRSPLTLSLFPKDVFALTHP